MIITRGYANRLVSQGKATLDGGATACTGVGHDRYQIVIRHDIQRIDHYVLTDDQLAVGMTA